MHKLPRLSKKEIEALSQVRVTIDGTSQPLRATTRCKAHEEHFSLLRQELLGKSELCHQLVCTIVLLRRDIEAKYHAKRFHTILKHGIDHLCSELDTRWLISICDTIADFGKTPIDRLAGATISLWVNTIKMAESERYFMADTSLDFAKIEEYSNTRELAGLWDGMTLMKLTRGDMPRNLLKRLRTVLEASPTGHKIFCVVLIRIKEEPNLLSRLAAINVDFWGDV